LEVRDKIAAGRPVNMLPSNWRSAAWFWSCSALQSAGDARM